MRRRASLSIAFFALAFVAALWVSAPQLSEADTPAAVADLDPPETLLENGPRRLTPGSEPRFAYSSPDYSASFECSVDGAPFHPCDFGATTIKPALSDGPHSFEVRAVDQSGNVDPTPVRRYFTVDATPPEVEILSGPSGLTRDPTTNFTFRATGEDRLECALYADDAEFDEPPLRPCTGPHAFRAPRRLADNTYFFEVRATDRAFNEVRDSRAFRIYTAAPGPPPNLYEGSVLYVGGGDGIRVAFRLKHDRLIRARVAVRLDCVGPRGRRHFGRRSLGYASPGAPLLLDGRERFRFGPLRDEEESLTIEEKLVGRRARGSIVGKFSYYENLDYRSRRCQTGSYPFSEEDGVSFRARRR